MILFNEFSMMLPSRTAFASVLCQDGVIVTPVLDSAPTTLSPTREKSLN